MIYYQIRFNDLDFENDFEIGYLRISSWWSQMDILISTLGFRLKV